LNHTSFLSTLRYTIAPILPPFRNAWNAYHLPTEARACASWTPQHTLLRTARAHRTSCTPR
jgi:hypothetical protein